MKVTPFPFLAAPNAAAQDDERGGASVSPLPGPEVIDDSQLPPKNTTTLLQRWVS